MSELWTPQTPERIAGYYNPASTYADDAHASLLQLGERLGSGTELLIYKTEPDVTGMMESLDANLEGCDAAVLAGGDGAAGDFLEGMQRRGSTVPTAITNGGRIVDLGHMLHTAEYLREPHRIFTEGDVRLLRSIVINVAPPDDKPYTERAFAYWSIGASGQLGGTYSDKETRERLKAMEEETPLGLGELRRSCEEAKIAIDGLRRAPYLVVHENGADPKQIVDRNIPNGHREGGRLHLPIKLFPKKHGKDQAGMIDIRHPYFRSLTASVARLWLGQYVRVGEEQPVEFMVETPDGSDIQGQRNGDLTSYRSGSKFTVSLDPNGAPVFTTRRRYMTKQRQVRSWQ
jgi:hypothetical protein